jgi:transcriptional regulator with XRE-family HTH domain
MIDYQMDMTQDSKTKNFIKEAKHLVESGKEPSYKAIADKIGWHNNSLSLALKGKRNVPFDIYKKFAEIYKLDAPENKKTTTVEDDSFKDKYIELLEKNQKLEEKLDSLQSSLKEIPYNMNLLTDLIRQGQESVVQRVQNDLSQTMASIEKLIVSKPASVPGKKPLQKGKH